MRTELRVGAPAVHQRLAVDTGSGRRHLGSKWAVRAPAYDAPPMPALQTLLFPATDGSIAGLSSSVRLLD